MALYSVSTATFALVAGAAKTVVRFNTSPNRAGILRELHVVDRMTGTAYTGIGIQIKTGGTDGTGTSYTPQPRNNANACLATAKVNYSAEPTGATAGPHYACNIVADIRFDDLAGIVVGESSAIAIVLTAAEDRASGDVSVTALFQE